MNMDWSHDVLKASKVAIQNGIDKSSLEIIRFML